jgi:secondary thiamine-phosphate synthase enzyme
MATESFSVRTRNNVEFVNITSDVTEVLTGAGIQEGLCTVYCPHTTAGITINEAADPSVVQDMIKELNKIIPFKDGYAHMEGNSAAHIKSSIVGPSVSIPVENGRLHLGTWQGIFFCEFDGPRSRKVTVSIVPGA